MSYRLVVPSRERAAWLNAQATFNTSRRLSAAGIPFELYVREDDLQLSAYGLMANKLGATLVLQDPSALGAAQTYDSLIDQCARDNVERLVVLDDDLWFKAFDSRSREVWPKLVYADPEELKHGLDMFAAMTCEEAPAASLCSIMKRNTPGARSEGDGLVKYCVPLMWAYSFYIPHFAAHPEHRFWQGKHIEARCDLNLSLMLLTQGWLTTRLRFLFIPENVNNPGGCSTYRSIELERQSVKYLQERYPGAVKTHKMRGWVGDPNIERDAPSVQYNAAFNRPEFARLHGRTAGEFAAEHLLAAEARCEAFYAGRRA